MLLKQLQSERSRTYLSLSLGDISIPISAAERASCPLTNKATTSRSCLVNNARVQIAGKPDPNQLLESIAAARGRFVFKAAAPHTGTGLISTSLSGLVCAWPGLYSFNLHSRVPSSIITRASYNLNLHCSCRVLAALLISHGLAGN